MKDKRTATVMIKLTAEEKKVLLLLADKKGQSLSGYIRQLVYEKNAVIKTEVPLNCVLYRHQIEKKY